MILEYMRGVGLPLTRENYLAVAWPDAQEPLPWDLELELPEEIRYSPNEQLQINELLEPSAVL